MAAAVASSSFGAELKDSFKSVNAWVGLGISWLDEIEQFYRERSAIEKEYASKLRALATKYHEKKGKKLGSLSVGETPTLTPGSLESASLTTWGTQLTTLEKRSGEHERFAVELIGQVADPLKQFATKSEELRKNHVEYNTKLEKERDTAYTSLKRMKGKYDATCQELEGKRKKQDSSFDMNKSKAQQSYQQQVLESNNVKNSYLIAINVTNKSKEKYFHEYVPEVLDSLQDLNETRVNYLNTIWLQAASIETGVLTRSANHLGHLTTEIPRNNPKLDSMMFAQHNQPNWREPADMTFEPSPVWHDDSAFMVDDSAKIYLRNILSRSKASRGELRRELDTKRREVEKLQNQRFALRDGKAKGDEVNVVQLLFALKNDQHEVERKWMAAETEVNTIITVVGDISVGAQNHNFKSTTFKIPTNCDLCGDRIWGLSAKGFDCKDCGYTCHSKCELKVPADCPGEVSKEQKKKLKAERQEAANAALPVPASSNGDAPHGVAEMPALGRRDTMNSLSSGYAASAQRSVSGVSNPGAEELPAPGAAPGPKPVIGARKNRLVAPPPTTYGSPHDGGTNGAVELPAISTPSAASTASSEPRGRMMYGYTASGDGELSVEEGQELSIIEPDDGSGWATVKTTSGDSGVVPASYFEQLPPSIPLSTRPSAANRPQSSYSTASSTGSGATGQVSNPSTSTASLASAIKKKGPAVAPRRGAKRINYVTALYDYEARSDVEFSMKEGERFVLINRDAGDGWADVERGGVTKSVPANYLAD